ncbi:MAG: glycine cleavage T C-terminal barrel domain-containing protein [Deltaproteobacteria bacterium]|nr:glycine cleavage T C-terminal barrel domain-containing protein [Deltaproteobacteria bacterium]
MIIDLSDRCWIDVKGADARKFLNGILTNNIQALSGKIGCYSALCTPKGKMIADLFCYTCEDYFGIDCSASLKQTVLDTLKKYIIFQKVELADQSEKWGAIGILGALPFNIPEKEFEYNFVEWESFKFWAIRKKIFGQEGFEIWIQRDEMASLKSKLGFPELGKKEREILRIESATPLWGIDMDENTIPQEANLYSALNFNKGCYVGQEIIARLEHRGHVSKKLCQFKMEGKDVPQKGDKILSTEGKEVGIVTSACHSPRFQSIILLGYLQYAALNESKFGINGKMIVGNPSCLKFS